jgi:uncharacterized repeat protein (TIGR01451 family)
MLILQMHKFRSLLMIALLFFATATPSCAQEKPKRMIPGTSVKELVPESPNEKEDGISQIIFAQLFKPGETEYKRVGSGVLKDAPPLPTGYTLYKDRVYEVKTHAIITQAFNITIFNVPSTDNEQEFKRLAILHLEDDEMSPSGKSWNDVTLFTETADERIFQFVPKDKYKSLQPDFKSKQIAGVTDQFGIFALALAPEYGTPSTGPFTQIEVVPASSPEPVAIGEEVTHTIVIKNTGSRAAAEVNVKEELNPAFEYVSANSSQGSCNQSRESTGRVLCHLGALPVGASATITIVARVPDNLMRKSGDKMGNDIEVNFKESVTNFAEADNQVFKDFNTTIVRRH